MFRMTETSAASDAEATALPLPGRPEDLRDWLQTCGLNKYEDYLIDPKVQKIVMGLGWDKGVDVDASAALLTRDVQVIDMVWWHKLKSNCKSVTHSGDDRTGEGTGDDETITVDIPAIPLDVHHILFTVCIYSEGYTFNDVTSAYVRMMHGKQKYNHHVLCRFELTEMSGRSLLMGLLTRKGAYWSFRALGIPASGRSIADLLQVPENLACVSQVPSIAPTFRHVSVKVCRGTGLAAKDTAMFGRVRTSDPYFTMKFRGKTYKSPHINKTLEPIWDTPFFELGLLMETEPKAVKIEVFDFDRMSNDDFMGMIELRGSALFNLGPGVHKMDFRLEPSKKPEYRNEEVSGSLFFQVRVEDSP